MKKWAVDDLNKTIQWLENQEEKVMLFHFPYKKSFLFILEVMTISIQNMPRIRLKGKKYASEPNSFVRKAVFHCSLSYRLTVINAYKLQLSGCPHLFVFKVNSYISYPNLNS